MWRWIRYWRLRQKIAYLEAIARMCGTDVMVRYGLSRKWLEEPQEDNRFVLTDRFR